MNLLFILCAVAALSAFIHFLRRFSTAWSMRGWRCTQGRVITAEMRRGRTKNSDGCLLYDPVLRYSYSVGGHTFEGTRFTHKAVRNADGLATQFIARLSQDAEVPVYYHPHNPAEALVRPLPWQGSAMAALACALLLFLLAAGYYLA